MGAAAIVIFSVPKIVGAPPLVMQGCVGQLMQPAHSAFQAEVAALDKATEILIQLCTAMPLPIETAGDRPPKRVRFA